MSQNTVYQMIQDSQGFIWLATGDGLNRFDGHTVVVYRHDPANPASLADNYLRGLVEDRDGSLWIATLGAGLDRFDPRTERFEHFRHTPDDPGSLPSNGVRTVLVDRTGTLWVGTGEGLARRAPGESRFTRLDPRAAAEETAGTTARPASIHTLHERTDGTVLIGTSQDGVYVQDPQDGRFRRLALEEQLPPLDAGLSIQAFAEDAEGTLWIGTENAGLLRVRPDGKRIDVRQYAPDPAVPDSLPGLDVTSVLPARGGRLWIGTWGGGLVELDPRTGHAEAHRTSLADPNSPPSDTIQALFRDRGGLIWVGTFDRGAGRFDEHPRFQHHYRDPLNAPSLPDNTVWAFAEGPGGDVWVGTAAGIGRFSPSERRFRPLPGTLPPELRMDVRALQVIGGEVWAGTWGQGLIRWNPLTGAVTRYPELSGNQVRLLLPGHDGRLWIGTQRGLDRLDPRSGRVERFEHDPHVPDSLPHNRIRALAEDRNGTLWVGTSGGLARFDGVSRFTSWHDGQGEHGGLPDNDVRAIHETADGALWIATGGGLSRFQPGHGPTHTIDERHGLSNATLYGILEDGAGQLWISSNRGLSRFDPATGSVRVFLAEQGLQDNEFNFGAWLRLRNGAMLFGGIGGFSLFDPAEATAPPLPGRLPALVLEDVLVQTAEGPRALRPDGVTPALLQPGDRGLTLRAAVLDYDRPADTVYATLLDGRDSAWQPMPRGERTITTGTLPAGDYVLRVRATTVHGLPARNEIAFPFVVAPSPWMTPWAYGIYALAAALSGFALAEIRRRSLLRQAVRLEREVARQTQALADSTATIERKNAELETLLTFRSNLYRALSHELRTPLSVVLSALQSLRDHVPGESRETVGVVLDSARRLNRLVEQLLLLARAEARAGAPPAAPLAPAASVHTALPMFRLLAESRAIVLEDRLDDACRVVVPEEALDMAIQNLLSNAVKYTPPGGRVTVEVTERDGAVALAVTDTGIGVPAWEREAIFQPFHRVADPEVRKEPGAGIGLSLVREVVQRHGGWLRLDSTPGMGSVFTVFFPAAPRAVPRRDDGQAPAKEPAAGVEDEHEDADAQTGARPDGQTPVVLIIDDDPDLRAWLPRLLGGAYTCHVAASAEEGLEEARMLMPDAILCDVMLPAASGFAFAETLRADPCLDHIPLVLLTALGDDDHRLAGLDRGVDDYIAKPFDNRELVLRLRNLLDNRQRVQAHALRRQGLSLTGGGDQAGPAPAPRNGQASFLDRLERELLDRLGDQSLELPDVARACGLSERQFQRKLHAQTGCSFGEYRTALRMREARALLATTGTVTDIALTLGYSTSAYFSKVFKDVHGMPPSEWRSAYGTRATGGGEPEGGLANPGSPKGSGPIPSSR